jgi:hypothetical protein
MDLSAQDGDRTEHGTQPLPASLAHFGVPEWEIYRFELVYFDPEFRRWQLFQEQPTSGGERDDSSSGDRDDHRQTIQTLLQSIRGLFHLPFESWGIPMRLAPQQSASDSLKLTIPSAQREHFRDCLTQPICTAFIRALRSAAQKDGMATPGSALETALAALETWLPDARAADPSVDSVTARQIISLLPVLSHWDLWGAVRCGWEQGKESIPPSPFQDLGRLRDPFYASHFVYQFNGSDDKASRSRGVLGYTALAEASFVDLRDPQRAPRSIYLRDCFDYVYTPKGLELHAYRLYALLMDRLQIALSGSDAFSSAPRQEHLYYVSYPIFSSLGRRHFLQVYINPLPKEPAPTVKHAFDAFEQLHRHLLWSDLHDVLIDELEQVDLARFHQHIDSELGRIQKKRHIPENLRDDTLSGLLAKNLHILFPIEASGHKTTRWHYVPFKSDELPLGSEWEESGDASAILTEGPSGIKWRPVQEGVRETERVGRPRLYLNEAYRSRLVSRQFVMMKRNWSATAGVRDIALKEKRGLWESHRAQLAVQAFEKFGQLHHTESTCQRKFSGVVFMLDGKSVEASVFFEPLIYIKGLDFKDETAWKLAFDEMISVNGNLAITQFLECGAAFWLTHPPTRDEQVENASLQSLFVSARDNMGSSIGGSHQNTSHATCLNCFKDETAKILDIGAGAVNVNRATFMRDLYPAQAIPCVTCSKHSTHPDWLPRNATTKWSDNLAQLHEMRNHAFRFRLATMPDVRPILGLTSSDTVEVVKTTDPVLAVAPAGLKGWKGAVDGWRDKGALHAIVFCEPRATPVSEGIGGAKEHLWNYILLCRRIDDNYYPTLGSAGHENHSLAAFPPALAGLGRNYCVKFRTDSSASVSEHVVLSLPSLQNITETLKNMGDPLITDPGKRLKGLTAGSWVAVVVILERMKA